MRCEDAFGGCDWWNEFIDKHIVPHLATQFIAIRVIPPYQDHDNCKRLITRWMPVLSPRSTMEKALGGFMQKWLDGLKLWLWTNKPTKEEAMDWHQEWTQLLTPDLARMHSEIDNGLKLIQVSFVWPLLT